MKTTGALIASAITLLSAASLAQAQSPPVGYWKGDDGASPTQALNSATGMSDGTYTGSATTNAASKATLLFPNASSMSFNGTSATVDVPSFSWPAGGGPITIAFWNFVVTAQNSTAFSVGGLDDPNRCNAHAPWGDQIIYWDYGNLSSGRISTSYAGKLNKWTHVALVSAGAGGSFKAIYLDGAVATSAGTASSGPASALSGLHIGAWTDASSYHNGLIDDFRIYNRVLTAPEIAALSAGNTEPATPTGLVATASVNQDPGTVTLVWNAASGASSYNLKWGTTLGGPYPNVISVAGTTYTHTPLTVNVTYSYVVSAVNSLGESANSSSASARPTPPPRTSVVGNEKDSCGCGVASGNGGSLLACGLAALAVVAACGRQRTRPNAILR